MFNRFHLYFRINKIFSIKDGIVEIYFTEKPSLKKPILIASWLGMGILARISADYLIKKLNAKQFAEIRCLGNDIFFKNGIGKLSQFKYLFF
jgi:hypothetical protein